MNKLPIERKNNKVNNEKSYKAFLDFVVKQKGLSNRHVVYIQRFFILFNFLPWTLLQVLHAK